MAGCVGFVVFADTGGMGHSMEKSLPEMNKNNNGTAVECTTVNKKKRTH